MGVKLPPFQALLDEHRTDLYRFCVATAGWSEADDCFQETWIAALRAYPKLRSSENLRAWLFRIAQNKAIDLHRSRARRPVPVESVPEAATAPPAVPAVDGEPELWAHLRELPPKQRTAVFCRTVLGMPYEELAELLESTEDAARHNVSEGLKKLRKEWTA
jgi:RNA polymerase sigma factor (sigma-70 family)